MTGHLTDRDVMAALAGLCLLAPGWQRLEASTTDGPGRGGYCVTAGGRQVFTADALGKPREYPAVTKLVALLETSGWQRLEVITGPAGRVGGWCERGDGSGCKVEDILKAAPGPATADHAGVLLAEYAALKAEQLGRIGTRDNLLYAVLGVIGAVLAAALTARQPACLLVIPPACVVIGYTYLANDAKISAIREYIRGGLAPRLDALTGYAPSFGWESAHLADPQYGPRKGGHLAVDLLAFAAAPAAAVIMCVALYSGPFLAVAAVFLTALTETAAVVWLARRIVRGYRHPYVIGGAS